MRFVPVRILTALLLIASFSGRGIGQQAGDLFDRVVETLATRYWDREFRRGELPALAAKFRAAADGAESLAEECAVVDGLLSHVPSSHLALFSKSTHRSMLTELAGRRQPMFGFQIKQKASMFFACKILEGGPAAKVGLRRGDRVLSVDGIVPHRSKRFDRRSDDAYLDDAPLHALLVRAAGERITLVVERRPGEQLELDIVADRYCALLAARASVDVLRRGDRRIGLVHFWYIHAGCASLLQKLAKGQFADCDSMVLDLRGRGGSGAEARRILRFFSGSRRVWTKPFVVLMDRESRSAKEMLAYEFKTRGLALLFGEKSAGALVPAMFAGVGQGLVLMYPGMRLRKYSDVVELIGVEPDVRVEYPLPFSDGADPVLEAALDHLARR